MTARTQWKLVKPRINSILVKYFTGVKTNKNILYFGLTVVRLLSKIQRGLKRDEISKSINSLFPRCQKTISFHLEDTVLQSLDLGTVQEVTD